MIYILVIIHVLVAIGLVISILLQSGRGGGLAAGLGGSFGASAVFGGRGAGDFLAKVTAGLGIAFVVLTILINTITSRSAARPTSIIQQEAGKTMPAESPSGMPPATPPFEGE